MELVLVFAGLFMCGLALAAGTVMCVAYFGRPAGKDGAE